MVRLEKVSVGAGANLRNSMSERSIHDSRVVGYEVDGERRRIVLHTQFKASDCIESIDIIFEGFLAYYFENDNFGNILIGVEELPVAQLVGEYRSLFEEGAKCVWPGPWNQSIEACVERFRSKGAKAFEISFSYGLAGWIIAESHRLQ